MSDLAIICPSGAPDLECLKTNISDLNASGISCTFSALQTQSETHFNGCPRQKAQDLVAKIKALGPRKRFILAGRGGYGCQDLLPYIPWTELQKLAPVCLVGFSDITALQAAFYTKLKWPSIHGPMPGSPLWQAKNSDVIALKTLLSQDQVTLTHTLTPLTPEHIAPTGEAYIFGGCLSVLTNLIATGYLPDLAEHILFFEDINEHPGQILRYFSQWQQSGALSGAQALILGRFKDCGADHLGVSELQLKTMLAKRLNIPVYSSDHFGHDHINEPIGIGYQGYIQDNQLIWTKNVI